MDPNEMAQVASQLGSGTPWGLGMGSLFGLLWFLDKFFANRKGDNQRVLSITEHAARVTDRLRDETKRADDNQDRADKLADMVNTHVRDSAEIKAQNAQITERLEWLLKQNAQLISQNETLVQQNNDLRAQLNEVLKRGMV
jgi:hypothetical protein